MIWAEGQGIVFGAGIRDGVAWCTVALAPQPWSFAIGEAQALGEFAIRQPKHAPRAAIDLAYDRLYAVERPPLVTLPGARFSCHGSGTCCRCDYAINVGPNAQAFIDAIPWEAIRPDLKGTQLEPLRDGRLKLKARDERCRFLDDQERCVIHQALGRPVFGPCTVFPYAFAWTPDGIAVGTSGLCSSVRGGLGPLLTERADDIYQRLHMSLVPQPKLFWLTPDVEIPWEAFQAVEDNLLALLERDELPLHRRLWAGCRYFEHILDGKGWMADLAWASEEIPSAPSEDVRELQAFLMSAPRAFLEPLQDLPIPEARHDGLRRPEWLAGMFMNLLHAKTFSYKFDLMTGFHTLVILYLLAVTLQAHYPDELPEELWEELGMVAFHGPLANQLFPDGVDAGAKLRRVVAARGYGRRLLQGIV